MRKGGAEWSRKSCLGDNLGILTFVMMMAPIVHAVPTRIIDARRASWLLPLAAVLPLSILLFFLFRCLSRMSADSGLGDVYHLAFGSRWGKVCCGLSAMWTVMIMVVDLRFYAERYVSAVYPEAGKLVFYLAMAVLQLWIVREDLNCLLRAGKVFFWVVTLTLAAVLLLAIGKIRLYNLWPVTDTSWREVGLGTIRLSTAISMAVPAGFLLGKVQWKTRKSGAVWMGRRPHRCYCGDRGQYFGRVWTGAEPASAGPFLYTGQRGLRHRSHGTVGVHHLRHVDDDGYATHGCPGLFRRTSLAPGGGGDQTTGMGAADFDSGLGRCVLCTAQIRL